MFRRLFACLMFLCVTALPVAAQTPLSQFLASSSKASSAASDTNAKDASSPDQARDALIKLLKDPAGRAALIGMLEGLKSAPQEANGGGGTAAAGTSAEDSKQSAAGGAPTTSAQAANPASDTLAMQVGEYTKLVSDDLVNVIGQTAGSLSGLGLLVNGDVSVRWEQIWSTVRELIVVFFFAFAVYWILRLALRWLYSILQARAHQQGWLWRGMMLLVTSGLDLVTVAIGGAAGYAAAITSFGPLNSGASLFESLALNAFMATGVAKAVLRFVLAPYREKFRLLPFSTETSLYWYYRLGLVIALLSYGVMLAVPLVNLSVSFVVGNAVRVLVVIAATLLAITFVLKNRIKVRDAAITYANSMEGEMGRQALSALARVWFLAAIAYILVVFVVWVGRPFDAVAVILRATGLSVLTIMVGFLISMLMGRAILGGVHLPDDLRERLPALEGRLNAFVPRLLKVARFIVFVVTCLILLDVWSLFDLNGWIHSAGGGTMLRSLLSLAILVLIGFAIWLAVMSWVDLRLRERTGHIVSSRERTLFQLFRNAFTVVMLVMTALLALAQIGVDIGPLIAGAGVLGLAISFGAQTLVKDIITGAFIQIENAVNEGDVVTIGGITGTVERLTVRSARMRDLDGTTHIIPFSSVDIVSNFMRDFSYHVAVIGVSYDTNIKDAKEAMVEAFERLKKSESGTEIIGDLEMHGVTAFADSSVNLRARIKTYPGMQWGIGRAYNELLKEVFDERGIEIPFPQVTYHRGDKSDADRDVHLEMTSLPASRGDVKEASSKDENSKKSRKPKAAKPKAEATAEEGEDDEKTTPLPRPQEDAPNGEDD